MGCENCKHLIIQNGFAPKCIRGCMPYCPDRCPFFERDKNIDNYRTAKPKKEIITNRQWLNSLSNEDFAEWLLDRQNMDLNTDDLVRWLAEERKYHG